MLGECLKMTITIFQDGLAGKNMTSKTKMEKLKVTLMTYEGAILNAIEEAKIANQRIIKLGIPKKIQERVIRDSLGGRGGGKLKELFGIKVIRSGTLQITTEFSIIKIKQIK